MEPPIPVLQLLPPPTFTKAHHLVVQVLRHQGGLGMKLRFDPEELGWKEGSLPVGCSCLQQLDLCKVYHLAIVEY